MKKVFICSPYAPYSGLEGEMGVEINRYYAIDYCKVAFSMGYVPFAPHLIYPEILDENNPKDRELGIQAGLHFLSSCDEVWVFSTHISSGMQQEIDLAREIFIPVYRILTIKMDDGSIKYAKQQFTVPVLN